MTAQIPDRLINDYPEIDLSGLHVYAVIVGDIEANHGWGEPYAFTIQASPDPRVMCSALWRGYVSLYQLNDAGHLTLTGFEYPFHTGRAAESVTEALVGDFWLLVKESFFANRIYIPFLNGVVVKDRSRWVHETRPNNSFKPTPLRGSA